VKYTLLALAVFALSAQTPKVESCGLGQKDAKGHVCHCMAHWSEVQNEYLDKCQGKDRSTKKLVACIRDMPQNVRDHCAAVESYGNRADESKPMPSQCSSACKRRDCKCGERQGVESKNVCHFGVGVYTGDGADY
jgi:hypothetical protein